LTDVFGYLFFTAFTIVIVDPSLDVSLFQLLAFFLTITGYSLQFTFRNLFSENLEAKSAIEAVKSLFKYPRSLDVEELDIKLYSIYDILGMRGLMSVLFDMALS
jgi:hypothetical protein